MSKDTTKKGLGRVNTAKKLWYKIVGPRLFGQMELGETYLSSPGDAVGRTLKVNLKDLTGNVKDQNAYVKFKVDALEGNTLKASTIGYELTYTYVKKMVRKSTNKLDDYFVFRTKDGKDIIVKTLMVTQSKCQRSAQKQLRQTLQAYLDEEAKNSTFETFISNLVTRKVQMTAKKILYKIYPLNEIAVRVLSLKKTSALPEGLPVEEQKEEAAVKETTETAEEQEGPASTEAV